MSLFFTRLEETDLQGGASSYFLEYAAVPDLTGSLGETFNPLSVSIGMGRKKEMRLLLVAGAKIEFDPRNRFSRRVETPIEKAKRNGHAEIIAMVFEAK